MEKGHTQIRILQILSKFDNGGIESFIMNYYRSLDKNKFQFDFVCDENSTIPYENEIKKLIIFKWNRVYPADQHLDIDPEKMTKVQEEEFVGFSHEKITMEVYEK